jgi:hypothetical protein
MSCEQLDRDVLGGIFHVCGVSDLPCVENWEMTDSLTDHVSLSSTIARGCSGRNYRIAIFAISFDHLVVLEGLLTHQTGSRGGKIGVFVMSVLGQKATFQGRGCVATLPQKAAATATANYQSIAARNGSEQLCVVGVGRSIRPTLPLSLRSPGNSPASGRWRIGKSIWRTLMPRSWPGGQ